MNADDMPFEEEQISTKTRARWQSRAEQVDRKIETAAARLR